MFRRTTLRLALPAVLSATLLAAVKVLMPGVIDATTNYVEHPELVAQRLERYARLIGQDRLMAGTDCGFATFASMLTVDPAITWTKLGAMAEGARIATDRLRS